MEAQARPTEADRSFPSLGGGAGGDGLSERVAVLETKVGQIEVHLGLIGSDLRDLRREMNEGQTALRQEMKDGQAALRQEMKDGQATLRQEMKDGQAALRQETTALRQEMTALRQEMAELRKDQREMAVNLTELRASLALIKWLAPVLVSLAVGVGAPLAYRLAGL